MIDASPFPCPIAEHIWRSKYRFVSDGTVACETSYRDTVTRVARAAAQAEPNGSRTQAQWQKRFVDLLADFEFLPGGRILAGAGTHRSVTLFNCFVMDSIGDDLPSIFENVKEAALTMQQGGGIGHDFSTLRPKGAEVKRIGADAAGPVAFMELWDAMCRTIMSAGARRGAMMGTLRVDHPDIEAFIDAKREPDRLRNFNLSILVTDAFMTAVSKDEPWHLTFNGHIYRTLEARSLWARIMRAAYDYAEPGVIFIDRVRGENNLAYCEEIFTTNPCGEQPLPPYGACLLGSLNLAQFIRDPFTPRAALDHARLAASTKVAIRFLDNIIDISNFPLEAQKQEALAKRRLGLGVTGLADALIFAGRNYGDEGGRRLADSWFTIIEQAAYEASSELAAEKGPFPLFDAREMLKRPNIQRLPQSIRTQIEKHGLRNGCLTSIAPAGTISLLAGNVSSGIEPVFDFTFTRRVLDRDGAARTETVEDFAVAAFRRQFGANTPLPDYFIRAQDLTPEQHLKMQAVVQRHIDSSISKTINCAVDIPFENFESIFLKAYDLDLKGCTVYRPNAITGSVLSQAPSERKPESVASGPIPGPTSNITPINRSAGNAATRSSLTSSAGKRASQNTNSNIHQPAAKKRVMHHRALPSTDVLIKPAICPDCGSLPNTDVGTCVACHTCGQSKCE